MNCRYCKTSLEHIFIDLGNSPPSNSFILKEDLGKTEAFYPLKVFVCEKCFLVQIDEYKRSVDIFNDFYPYFSSYSRTWLKHAEEYVEYMVERFKITNDHKIVEIASNDGYLLQYFSSKGIPVLGIEPSSNTAEVAIKKGIDTVIDFFSSDLAIQIGDQHGQADLLLGNNVLAHVPDITDFVKGLKILLKPEGIITMEFPHLMKLIQLSQFDTIYHEHYSYFSFHTVKDIFESQGLTLFDVQEFSTHGGSLRIFAKHDSDDSKKAGDRVAALLKKEKELGMCELDFYSSYEQDILRVKYELLEFLVRQKKDGKKVIAYGAAAKGNTLLNFCGVKQDLINFVVDASPFKQGKYMPASHIPIVVEEKIKQYEPDFVLILPWNIQDEIMEQLRYIREWNGKFVIPLPKLSIS